MLMLRSQAILAGHSIDDPLIRRYSDCWRADAVGLAAGTYDMKVVPNEEWQ